MLQAKTWDAWFVLYLKGPKEEYIMTDREREELLKLMKAENLEAVMRDKVNSYASQYLDVAAEMRGMYLALVTVGFNDIQAMNFLIAKVNYIK